MGMGPFIKMVASDESSYCSSNVLVIDEPDSTTTATISPTSQIALAVDAVNEGKAAATLNQRPFSIELIINENVQNATKNDNNSIENETITTTEVAQMITTNFVGQPEPEQSSSYYLQQQSPRLLAKNFKFPKISNDYDRYDNDNEAITTTTIDGEDHDDATKDKKIVCLINLISL